jgi:hypothetical protein
MNCWTIFFGTTIILFYHPFVHKKGQPIVWQISDEGVAIICASSWILTAQYFKFGMCYVSFGIWRVLISTLLVTK